ncbi:hypothetical protein ACFQ3Z_19265 [Streptomyces nogalater]
MSRTVQPRPRHRPPTRRDTRRPGGAPSRTAGRAHSPRTAPLPDARRPAPPTSSRTACSPS